MNADTTLTTLVMTQQFMSKFVQSLRDMINDSDLPCADKDSASAVLDISAETTEAVASTHESAAINESAEAIAEAAANSGSEEGLDAAFYPQMAGDSERASEFTIAQPKFTAAMQIFSIYSTLVATTLKTLGEAMSAIARKQ